MLEAMFARDLAPLGSIAADAPSHPDCGPENLLLEDEDLFYASENLIPTVTLTFAKAVTFDCWALEEVIELGHRVRGFRVEICVDGAWKPLAEGQCIGFHRCERTAPGTASALRVRILEAGAEPVLRRIRLYNTRGVGLENAKIGPTGELPATLTRENGELLIDLGGIYPYNTVEFKSTGPVVIHAFNGTRYEPIWSGIDSPARFQTVTGSYRLKITGDAQMDSVRVSLADDPKTP